MIGARLIAFLVVLIATYLSCDALNGLSSTLSSAGVRFRQGTKNDEFQIATTMVKELMNPLGIQSERFVVAVDPNDDKKLYGWAQLRPIGSASVDPDKFDARPGSGNAQNDVEIEYVNEEIWEEFEKDDVIVPNGFASFPWTKEYKDFSESAAKRRERRDVLANQMEAAKMQAIQDTTDQRNNQLWELASVYVLPQYRGHGIGSEVVRRLLVKHRGPASNVYILTLNSTREWYQNIGFEVTMEPPEKMKFEMAAGKIITNFINEELICMRHV